MSTTFPPMPTDDRPTDAPLPDSDRWTSIRNSPPPSPKRLRRRKSLKIVGSVFVVIVVVLGTVAYWALDRFVIDHVEISDVAAFESAQRAAASTSTEAATQSTELSETAPSTSTSTGAIGTDIPAVSVADTAAVESIGGDDTVATADPANSTVAAEATATSYVDGDTSITISKVVTGSSSDTVTYFVADVIVDDAAQLRAGFAENKFGTNIIADTSEIAEDNDAIFAINGDYYGFRDSGIVIRNGVLFRDDGARTGLAMYADGHMEIFDETATSGEQLLADGVINTLSFGPALLDGGEILEGIEDIEIDTNFGNHSVQGSHPRTGIGMIDANHFVFVVVDGRSTGYSKGVTMTEFAEIFQELGVTVAYNLDGGGSSTMYFNGELVNNPLGKGNERGTSDILYIA